MLCNSNFLKVKHKYFDLFHVFISNIDTLEYSTNTIKKVTKIQYNYIWDIKVCITYKHRSMSFDEPKMKIVFFMDDFKKGIKLILFLFVDNRSDLRWSFIIFILFSVMSNEYILYLDLQNYHYIFIMFCALLYIAKYVSYTVSYIILE